MASSIPATLEHVLTIKMQVTVHFKCLNLLSFISSVYNYVNIHLDSVYYAVPY